MTSIAQTSSRFLGKDAWTTRQTILFASWIGLFVCQVYAFSYSSLPNQIFWLYVLSFCAVSFRSIRSSDIAYAEVIKIFSLHALYIAAFYIVSVWEMFPGTSARALPTYSLNGLLIVTAFAAGYELSLNQLIRSFEVCAWLVVIYTVGQWQLEPNSSRFGAGVTAMILLPVVMAVRKTLLTVCLAIVMLGSLNLTPTIGGFAAVGAYNIFYFRGDFARFIRFNSNLLAACLTLGGIGAYAARGYLYSMAERFITHDDPLRTFITENSIRMLLDSNGWGIGYMNFYVWSGLETGYKAEGRTGAAIEGFNLHNSYMTWALEGGVLVCVVVAWMLALTFKRIRRLSKFDPILGALLYSWFVAFALLALYHQLHMAVQFWCCIGLIWGIHAKLTWSRRTAKQYSGIRAN